MATLAPGLSFGKYRIQRMIGRGGMGIVYLAEDETLGRQIALKVLDHSVTSGEEFARRFRVEARTIANFQHPYIIQIHSLEHVGDEIAIDMEYVPGGSLADAEKAGPVPATLALACIRDTLLALACCHEEGIIHRDVKPSNLLIRSDGHAVLSDFGLAKLLAEYQTQSISQRTSSGMFLGTPRYAPPEAWDGQEPAPAWDVYSTGMVLYEAILGTSPYVAETPLSLMKEMLEKQIPPLHEQVEGVSLELSNLVAAMLARVPEDRPANAGEVLESYQRLPELAGGQAARLDETRTRLKTAPARRMRRAPARAWWREQRKALGRAARIAGGVVLVLAMVTAGFAVWSRRPSGSRPATPPAAPAASQDHLIFDSIDPMAHAALPNHWLMLRAPGSDQWEALAAETTRLWYVRASPQAESNDLAFGGSWAEYADPSARVFRYGTLTGTGTWLRISEEMAVTLNFRSLQDGSESTEAFFLRLAATPISTKDFIYRMELGSHAQALLYKELMPRNQAWAQVIESKFFCSVSPCATVPRLADKRPQIDGMLEDAVWRDFIAGAGTEPGMTPASVSAVPAELRLRYDNEALYLAFEAKQSVARPALTITVLPRFGVPVPLSERWAVRTEKDTVLAAEHLVSGRSAPWSCDWEIAEHVGDTAWTAEVRIPFAGIGEEESPKPGDRWRLNCQITDAAAGADFSSVYWGSEKPLQAELGVILVFQSAETVRGE